MNANEEVAKNLAFYRKKSKFTQKQLAEMLGVRNTSISNWENCTSFLDIDTLAKVCKILNVSIVEMFGNYSNVSEELPERYTEKEKELIMKYRQLPEEGKRYAENTLDIAYNSYVVMGIQSPESEDKQA